MHVARNAPPPRKEHLRHWYEVCRFIDAEPYRSVFYPFQSVADPPHEAPPMSPRLLQRMERFGLVRHRFEDCTWRLSPRWQPIMDRLLQGLPPEEEKPPKDQTEQEPFIANFGIDTLYVNILAEDLPAKLVDQLNHYKEMAQDTNDTVVTPWSFLGIPLTIYKTGKGAPKGKGVSWGYILRHEGVEIKLRRTAVSGIVVSFRLGAESLWRHPWLDCLNAMKQTLKGMWADVDEFRKVSYQLSEIHLCADIANFLLEESLLKRLVTHSLSQQVHLPASDEPDDFLNVEIHYDDDFALFDEEDAPYISDDLLAIALGDEEMEEETNDEEEEEEAPSDEEEEETPSWAEDGAVIHFFGKRIQGFSFSLNSDLSCVWYNKLREEVKSGKGWMREIHERGGWKKGMSLTRIEARFKRGILRELSHTQGKDNKAWFDDPWEVLKHLGELWAYFAGLPLEGDFAPDVTHRGWMRLVEQGKDTNRSRIETAAIWRLVQRVPFGTETPQPLKRSKRIDPVLDQLLLETYGILKTIAVKRGSYKEGDVDFWDELVFLGDWAAEVQQQRGQAFAQEVRERARMLGNPLPLVAPSPRMIRRRG